MTALAAVLWSASRMAFSTPVSNVGAPNVGALSNFADYVQLLLVTVPFIAAPGPGNLMCAATGARFGLRRMVSFLVGLELMVFVPALAVGLGVGAALEQAGDFLEWLQLAGSLFILYLAFRVLREPPVADEALSDVAPRGTTRRPGFVDAVLLQALNAKGAVVLVVIFAEFADPTSTVSSAVRIAAVITIVSLVFHLSWMSLGEWLTRRFSSPRAQRLQARTYAAMLAVVAIWLLAAT